MSDNQEITNETSASIYAWACAVLKQDKKRFSTHISKLGEELSELQREINKLFQIWQIRSGTIVQTDYDDPFNFFGVGGEDALLQELSKVEASMSKEFADVTIVVSNLAEALGTSVPMSAELPPRDTHINILEAADELAGCFETFGSLSFNCMCCDFDPAVVDSSQAVEQVRLFVQCLHKLARTMGVNIQGAVNSKMKINRGRQWNIGIDGTGSHVKGS